MKRLMLVALVIAVTGCGKGRDTGSAGAGADSTAADSTARMNLVLTTVGDLEITGGNVRDHLHGRLGERAEEYMKNPDVLQVALSGLVDQYVWAAKAKKAGIELDPEDQRKVINLETELLSKKYVTDVVDAKAKPTEADIKRYYNENQVMYMRPVSVAVRHILVDTREQARSIKQQLENGADFTALVQKYSKDEATKNGGGALGYIRVGKAVLPIGRDMGFEQVVLALNEGEVGIVQTSMGWHVVKAEKKEGGTPKPLSEVHDQVEKTLFAKQYGRVYNRELAKAREELDVSFNTENFEKFSQTDDNTKRLMDLAITISEPRARAEAYRRLAYDFPDAPEAAEALFRMGHILLINQGDKVGAESAFRRITVRYPMSQWKRAANFMLENMDMTPEDFGTPEEILALVKEEPRSK